MNQTMKRIWKETAVLMAAALAIALALLAAGVSFWVVFLVTGAFFISGDIYYKHHPLPRGYDDE